MQLNLAKELLRRGMEAQLLVREEGEFAKRWRQLGQKVHIVPFRPASVFFIPFISSLSSVVRKMADIIQSEQIQIAHGDYHSLPYLAPAAKRVGVPRVWICMGWWFDAKPWQYGLFRNIEALFALTQTDKDGFLRKSGSLSRQIEMEVLYLGLDTDALQSKEFGKNDRDELIQKYDLDPDCLLVLHVGRFQNVKGHDTFQEVARIVSQENPHARFLVVGENLQRSVDATYQRKILASAKADPILNERIVYAGFVENIFEVYAAADVFVCPSRFESYAVAVLEAMACGVPVVSTNRGGPSEIVVEGVTGFLVPPRDANQYADRIMRLLEDPELRQKMGAAGRQHVAENFNIKRRTNLLVKQCERLISPK